MRRPVCRRTPTTIGNQVRLVLGVNHDDRTGRWAAAQLPRQTSDARVSGISGLPRSGPWCRSRPPVSGDYNLQILASVGCSHILLDGLKGREGARWLVSNDRIWRPRANPTNRVARRWPHEPQNRSVDQIRSARDRSLALSDERAANDTAHLDQFSAFVGDTDVAGPCRPCTLPAHQSGSVESVTRTDRGAYGDADHLDCQALVIHRNTPVMHVAPTSRVNLRRGARAVS